MTEYVRHTAGASWGVGVLVAETRDQRTYLFADGVKRTFKTALVARFITPAEAPSEEDRARLARGRSAGGIATPIAINLELEAQIRANPGNPEPYLVYADWLQHRKDPRGDLIAVHDSLAREPTAKLRTAEAALFDAHGTYFLPEALHHALRLPRRGGDDPRARCDVAWRMGFIERARLARRPKQQLDLGEVLARLVNHPSATFLTELVLGPLGAPDDYDYGPLVDAIAAAGLASLESLVIGDFTTDDIELRYTFAGDLAPVLASTPALQRLVVRGGRIYVDTRPAHAQLRELRLTGELEPSDRDNLVAASLPELVTLELSDGTLRAKDIAALAGFHNLRELIVRRTQGTQTILNALIASPLLARLDTLVLADGDLTDKAADKLERHAGKLAHLATLDVSGNPMSDASASKLARAGVLATPRIDRGALTEDAALRRTHAARNAAAARELAVATSWLALGRDGQRLWGEYEGRDHYYVLAQLGDRRAGCSCGSPRSPCKHALALLLLAARGHAFVERKPPEGLVRHASVERPRYWTAWE